MSGWRQVGFAFLSYALFLLALMVFASMLARYMSEQNYLIVSEPGPDGPSPAEISAVLEEAKRITREAGDA